MRAILIAAVAFATAIPALAAEQALLPPMTGDLVATRLVAAKSAPAPVAPGIERTPVQFAWALDSGKALQSPQPFVAESRAFYTELDAAALAKGHAFDATGAGAVVRISPLGTTKAQLAHGSVQILRDGRALGADAIEHAATAEQMKAAGASFAPGTLAFRIAPALGEGRFAVRVDAPAGRYLLHVYEPNSPYSATLATTAGTVHAGGTVQAFIDLRGAKAAIPAHTLRGVLSAPDGRVFDVDFALDAKGRGIASVALPATASAVPGLWELHGFAAGKHDGATVLRDAKTSFAVTAPTARLAGAVQTHSSKAAGMHFELPVKVAAPGRYELRAVLYGTAADGSLQPVAAAHSARWLKSDGSVDLHFPRDVLSPALTAPYELRQLVLNDQSRIARLETRAVAYRIGRAASTAPAGPER